MKLKDFYKLPGDAYDLSREGLTPEWFPEVPALQRMTAEQMTRVHKEGRLKVVLHAHQMTGAASRARLCTLWLDDCPVAIIRDTGNAVSRRMRRLVTDRWRMGDVLSYLRLVLDQPVNADDVADGEREVFPEEIADFCGVDFTKQLGLSPSARAPAFLRLNKHNLPGATATTHESLVAPLHGEEQVVVARDAQTPPPRYIRSMGRFFEYGRDLGESQNWRISQAGRTLARDYPRVFAYASIDALPAGAEAALLD